VGALRAQFLDQCLLVLGQHARANLVDAEMACHGFGGALVVAGRHDHPQAERVQIADRTLCRLLDRVGHGDEACEPAVQGDVHRGLAIAAYPACASALSTDADRPPVAQIGPTV
jgi:hypothetical protein